MLRYQLLPPDIVDRDEFVAFWQPDAHSNSRRAAENKAKRRLLRFDVDLEFGLQARTGRTLELTAVSPLRSTWAPRTRRRSWGGARSSALTPLNCH